MLTFPTRAAGIPCFIRVNRINEVRPWLGDYRTAPSSDDFYGFVEIDYTVLDRKGYEAPWLKKKISTLEDDRIIREILAFYE